MLLLSHIDMGIGGAEWILHRLSMQGITTDKIEAGRDHLIFQA